MSLELAQLGRVVKHFVIDDFPCTGQLTVHRKRRPDYQLFKMSLLSSFSRLSLSSAVPSAASTSRSVLPQLLLQQRTQGLQQVRTATKRGGGSSKNGRSSAGRRLGVKKFTGERFKLARCFTCPSLIQCLQTNTCFQVRLSCGNAGRNFTPVRTCVEDCPLKNTRADSPPPYSGWPRKRPHALRARARICQVLFFSAPLPAHRTGKRLTCVNTSRYQGLAGCETTS